MDVIAHDMLFLFKKAKTAHDILCVANVKHECRSSEATCKLKILTGKIY